MGEFSLFFMMGMVVFLYLVLRFVRAAEDAAEALKGQRVALSQMAASAARMTKEPGLFEE